MKFCTGIQIHVSWEMEHVGTCTCKGRINDQTEVKICFK